MSHTSQNVAFLCTHCLARFEAPQALKGARLLCTNCRKVTFVNVKAGPSPTSAQKDLLARLQGPASRWIRTTCSCGKVIKAPAALAGREGACPQCNKMVRLPGPDTQPPAQASLPESQPAATPTTPQPPTAVVSEFELIPSAEGSGILDISPTDKNASTFDFREIKYHPLKEFKPDPADQFDGFVRARCLCGQRVKAPAEQGGRIGMCPKCRGPVAMPLPPVFKLVSELDAMATSQDLEHIDDDNQDQKSAIIALGSGLIGAFDDLLDSMQVTPEPITAIPHHIDPESHLQSIAGDTFLKRRIFFTKLFLRRRYEKLRDRVWDNPLASIVISLVFLAAALALFVWQYQNLWLPQPVTTIWKSPPTDVPFYDFHTGALITGKSNQVSPIPDRAAQADPSLANDPAHQAFRAYEFSCASCAVDARFVGLIEKFDPGVAQAWQHKMQSDRIPHIPPFYDAPPSALQGRFLSRPTPLKWVPADSPQAIELRKTVEARSCPEGKTAQLCRQ